MLGALGSWLCSLSSYVRAPVSASVLFELCVRNLETFFIFFLAFFPKEREVTTVNMRNKRGALQVFEERVLSGNMNCMLGL